MSPCQSVIVFFKFDTKSVFYRRRPAAGPRSCYIVITVVSSVRDPTVPVCLRVRALIAVRVIIVITLATTTTVNSANRNIVDVTAVLGLRGRLRTPYSTIFSSRPLINFTGSLSTRRMTYGLLWFY